MEIRDKNGKAKKSIVLGTVFLVAAATIGYFSFFYPPSGKHLTGTIAPADRYRAEQIGKDDVKVEETDVTRWTQTAEFDRLSKDPAARKLFANAAFRNALTNDAFRNALKDDAFRNALTNDAFRNALKDDAFRDALRSDAFRDALRSDAFRDALRSDGFRDALKSDSLRDALARK
jgi:hypothetical protein